VRANVVEKDHSVPAVIKSPEPLTLMFSDDGSIPINPRLPLVVYRRAFDLAGTPNPEEVIEKAFARHGWAIPGATASIRTCIIIP